VTRCIFLDRDGTLIEDRGYIHRIEDYVRLAGAAQGLRRLMDAGYRLVIVTNQSGIGRGYFDEAAFQRLQEHLVRDFAREGVRFEATYFCPHLPDAGCDCRKPAPGMLERAARELDADLPASWVIGNEARDVELARNAGCRAVRLLEGPDPACGSGPGPDVPTVRDLEEAAQVVLGGPAQLAQ
jgi:D-glycero-D-manno-heptose 1,7-bisphosphate phosphatase